MGAASPLARRSLLVAALAFSLGAVLLMPATAESTIYPQRSIARIKLGMSPSQVKARLGRPAAKVRTSQYTVFSYPSLLVRFRSGGVVEVETKRSTERTVTRVGVGSTEWTVRHGVPGVVCSPYSILRLCRVGTGAPTTKVTEFALYNNKVQWVTLKRIPDKTPPTSPSDLTVTGTTKTSVSLSWSPSTDDVAVVAYVLYRNGLRVGKTSTSAATFSGLACGASYTFGVEAVDGYGNRSARNTMAASTLDCPQSGELFVAPTGSDANPCTPAAPCLTFDRAYRAAQSGQVVDVLAGTYAGQSVARDPLKTSSSDVIFRPSGGPVLLTGSLIINASHVEFRDISASRIDVRPFPLNTTMPPSDVTLRNLDANGFDIMSSSDVSVIGGDYGPSGDYGSHVKSCASCTQDARNILIDGVRVHDVVLVTPGAHVDCLHVWNTDTLLIQNSRFWNCEHFNILFTWESRHTGSTPDNVIVQNNFFDCCRSGYYSVLLGGGHREHYRNVLIRNNSANENFGVGAGTTSSLSNVRIYGNIAPRLPFDVCGLPGVGVDYNVWGTGSPCGKHDTVAASGFRNPSTFDFHLVDGAAAIDRGHPASYPVTDIDGNARPTGGAPDAGAHEHS